jgi:hypothetical protein
MGAKLDEIFLTRNVEQNLKPQNITTENEYSVKAVEGSVQGYL